MDWFLYDNGLWHERVKPDSKIFVLIMFILASACIMNDTCDVVTDASEALPAFCQSLEAILRRGLKSKLISLSVT